MTASVYIHDYDHSEPDHVINFHVNCHPGEPFNQTVARNFGLFHNHFAEDPRKLGVLVRPFRLPSFTAPS